MDRCEWIQGGGKKWRKMGKEGARNGEGCEKTPGTFPNQHLHMSIIQVKFYGIDMNSNSLPVSRDIRALSSKKTKQVADFPRYWRLETRKN